MPQATLWMLASVFSLSTMAIGARELSGDVGTLQTLFLRNLIGLGLVTTLILASGNRSAMQTDQVGLHFVRNIFHFAGQYAWFLGIGLLPLAEVFALEFTTPIWAVLIAALFLKEAITPRKALSVLLGFAGVLVIVQPGIQAVDPASFIVLAGAAGFAVAIVTTKSLTNRGQILSVPFYMFLLQTPIGFVLAISGGPWPTSLIHWFWVFVVATMALSAHYCMTRAMSYAEVGRVIVVDFLRLPLIAVVGVAFYSEPFSIAILLGAVLMLLGNFVQLQTNEK